MKKYVLTESQVKRVIDRLINEQMSDEDRYIKQQRANFDAVYNNPKISEQMKKYPNAKFGFSKAMIKDLDQDGANKLYQVKPGDTVSGIVQKLGANSDYNIMYSNDVLKNNPKALQAGMVIVYSLRPTGA
jgi:hypothetical protein